MIEVPVPHPCFTARARIPWLQQLLFLFLGCSQDSCCSLLQAALHLVIRCVRAHPVQVGMQLLPACSVFGGDGKEDEVHVGQNGQKNWFGLTFDGVFCLFLISTMCAYSEEIAFHRGEMSLLLISDLVAYFIASQMAHPSLYIYLSS